MQNKLGCDLYIRKFKDNFEEVECISKNGSSVLHLPPPRFPDKFVNVSEPQPQRHFVAIHVSEAKVQLVHLLSPVIHGESNVLKVSFILLETAWLCE